MQTSQSAHANYTKEQLNALCPYCHATASFLLASTDQNRRTTKESFRYYNCDRCHLIFMNPQPADMGPYYQGGYDAIPASQAELDRVCRAEKYRVAPILKRKAKGRYLEIGPWRGIMCNNMKLAGFEVTAIERDRDCIDYLANTLGATAIQSTDPAETMHTLPPHFDVIAAWHSLEHIPHPWRFVEEAGRILLPGGLLLISMPNPESYEFAVMKAGWMHLDAPRHLHLYPLATLQALCAANGMRLVESTTWDPFSRLLTRQSWHAWVHRAIPIPWISRPAASILRPAMRALARVRKGRAEGSSYTAMFMKQ